MKDRTPAKKPTEKKPQFCPANPTANQPSSSNRCSKPWPWHAARPDRNITARSSRRGRSLPAKGTTPIFAEEMKLSLATEVLRRTGSVCFRAQGTSMLPTLWPGDLLTIERVAGENLRGNDVILVLRDGHPVIHRLISGSRDMGLVTRGDAMPRRDAPGGELLGRVTEIRRCGRSFEPSRRGATAKRMVGLALCYCDLLRGLLLRIHGWRCGRRQSEESPSCTQKGFLNRTA